MLPLITSSLVIFEKCKPATHLSPIFAPVQWIEHLIKKKLVSFWFMKYRLIENLRYIESEEFETELYLGDEWRVSYVDPEKISATELIMEEHQFSLEVVTENSPPSDFGSKFI